MTKFSIPDMSCGHCKASIDAALSAQYGPIHFDMPAREITLNNAADTAAVLAQLAEIGFPAKVVANPS
jgi:copper chaperone